MIGSAFDFYSPDKAVPKSLEIFHSILLHELFFNINRARAICASSIFCHTCRNQCVILCILRSL